MANVPVRVGPPTFVTSLVLLASLSAGLTLGGREAWAQLRAPYVASPANEEEALLKEGMSLRENGNDQAALVRFQRAYEVSHSARSLSQVALAEQALGHWTSAEAHLIEAVAHNGDPWIAKNKGLLDMALSDIQGHLGSLELSGGVGGAEVRLDGIPVGALPFQSPLRVPAGSVAVEIKAAGYLSVLRTVTIQPRALTRELVTMVATPQPAPAGAPYVDPRVSPAPAMVSEHAVAESSEWGTRKKVGLGLAVGAAASLVMGGAFVAVQRGRADDFRKADCTVADPVLSPRCQSLKNKADSASTLSLIGFIGAAVLGGVGTVLFFTGGSSTAGGSLASANDSRSRLRRTFGCSPTPTGAVACFGEF